MADETVKDVGEEVAPKTKEEMRYEPHEYHDDNTGWCTVCGRSEAWRAHATPEPTSDTLTVESAPSTVATTAPLDAGVLEDAAESEPEEVEAAE